MIIFLSFILKFQSDDVRLWKVNLKVSVLLLIFFLLVLNNLISIILLSFLFYALSIHLNCNCLQIHRIRILTSNKIEVQLKWCPKDGSGPHECLLFLPNVIEHLVQVGLHGFIFGKLKAIWVAQGKLPLFYVAVSGERSAHDPLIHYGLIEECYAVDQEPNEHASFQEDTCAHIINLIPAPSEVACVDTR